MEDEQLAEEVVEAAPAGNEEIVEQPAIAVPAVEDPDGLNGLLQPNAVQEAPHRVAEIGELEFHEVVRDANAMIAEQLAWLERQVFFFLSYSAHEFLAVFENQDFP